MNYEDTFLVECQNDHVYAMVIGEDAKEYPCPFCGGKVEEYECDA